jgi:hypothetical protein
MDWILLAQDKDGWQGTANTVMNLQVPQNAWNFLNSQKTYNILKKDSAPCSLLVGTRYRNCSRNSFIHLMNLMNC